MITVFGSINLDLVVAVPHLPAAGETVNGPDHQIFAGGKGANQALSASRAGANVKMIGAVGNDAFSQPALANMQDAGIDLSLVRTLEGTTGLALIGVDPSGENQIIAASGANDRVEAEWLRQELHTDTILMLQGEVPFQEIRKAMAIAKEAAASVFWNPAPVPESDLGSCLDTVDALVVNELEAAAVTGGLGLENESDALLDHLATPLRSVVVTLGAGGVIAAKGTERLRLNSPEVTVTDTTGAGDAFCGALAAAFDSRRPFERALKEAVAAGALACTVTGAQSSAPSKEDIAALADKIV